VWWSHLRVASRAFSADQPRGPDGKFLSTGGSDDGGGSAPTPAIIKKGGTYKAGDKPGSKVKSAPNNVTSKGVNPNSEYVLSGKTGNFFANPQYNGNPEGKGKYSPNGKGKAQQGSIEDLEGGSKYLATGQAKHKVAGSSKPVSAKPVSAKPVSSGIKLSSPEGEITGDASAVREINKKFDEQNAIGSYQLHEDVNAGQKPLMAGEKAAVVRYTGSGYSGVNTKLRNDHKDLDEFGKPKADSAYEQQQAKQIAKLDKTLTSRELSQDVAVSRRVNMKTQDLKVGDEIYDPAFQSFSTAKRNPFGTNSSTIETVLPKGTKGMSVRKVSKYTSEDEILLPAGLTMRVTSIRGQKDGGKYITVELVSQGVRKGEPPLPVRSIYANR